MSVIDSSTLNRVERRRIRTREQLVQAATELLNEVGYARLTIKAITERADLGYGTFYLYFQDMDDIVWAGLYEVIERARIYTEEQISGLPSPLREYQSWVHIFEFAAQSRDSIVALFGRNGSAKLLQRYQDYLSVTHEENLRLGRYSSGLDLPPAFLAQFITGALVRLLIWWAETPSDTTPTQMADMLFEVIYRQPAPR